MEPCHHTVIVRQKLKIIVHTYITLARVGWGDKVYYGYCELVQVKPGHERLFGLNKPGYLFSLFEPGLDLVWEIGDCPGSIN